MARPAIKTARHVARTEMRDPAGRAASAARQSDNAPWEAMRSGSAIAAEPLPGAGDERRGTHEALADHLSERPSASHNDA